jgi:hypothetical protein
VKVTALLFVGCSLLLAAGCGGKEIRRHDPPRIVTWSSIGGVQVGSSRDEVRQTYGKPSSIRNLRTYFAGTRYSRSTVTEDAYNVVGGTLRVTYVDGVAKAVGTSSRRYKTVAGLRVGATLSRGPCHPHGGSCEYRWRGFSYEECGGAWVLDRPTRNVEIYMDRNLLEQARGRVAWIQLGDPSVDLYCF